MGKFGVTPRDHALIGQVLFAAVRLLGGDRRGMGGVSVGFQGGGVAADQNRQHLTDANRLARRDQHPFDTSPDSGGHGGAGVHHRLDAAGQANLAPSSAAHGDDRDADGFDLSGRQLDHALPDAFRAVAIGSAAFKRLSWRGFRLAVEQIEACAAQKDGGGGPGHQPGLVQVSGAFH